jgi:hypothetical protein
MLMVKTSPVRHWMALVVLIGVAVGCGKQKPVAPPEEGRKQILQALTVWNEYKKSNGNKPAKSMDELKTWAKKNVPEERLKEMGFKDVDELFTSPRDGQTYELHPPKPASPGAPPSMAGVMQTVLSEKVGVNGKKYRASGMGSVEEVSDGP